MSHKKSNPRSRHAQQVRMLKAAMRRAEKRGNSLDATWARAQLEIRTGVTIPSSTENNSVGVYEK